MTGGPGVGNTTIVKAILRILAAKGRVYCCVRKTIHRLFEVDPRTGGFRRGEDNPLDCDLLVVDEASSCPSVAMAAPPKRYELAIQAWYRLQAFARVFQRLRCGLKAREQPIAILNLLCSMPPSILLPPHWKATFSAPEVYTAGFRAAPCPPSRS